MNVVMLTSTKAIAYLTAILIAIGIAFINPIVSFVIYFLIVVAVIVLTAIGKVEFVTTLQISQKNEKQSTQEEEDDYTSNTE